MYAAAAALFAVRGTNVESPTRVEFDADRRPGRRWCKTVLVGTVALLIGVDHQQNIGS